jgi:uncharacterized protein YndB with AHSA1/START domain
LIAADPSAVWSLVCDPHNLPRWWPRAQRVEDVRDADGQPARWTTVLQTERGTGVRADYRCTVRDDERRFAWAQDLEGTPFERILHDSEIEVRLDPDTGGTRVTVASDETLRGLSRLGSPMVRGATRRRIDEALDGIERAVGSP